MVYGRYSFQEIGALCFTETHLAEVQAILSLLDENGVTINPSRSQKNENSRSIEFIEYERKMLRVQRRIPSQKFAVDSLQ